MRLVDADALFDTLFQVWGTEIDAGPANEFMAMINNAPTIAPPPNEPLTLEELREIYGEPVWIAPKKEGGKIPARWMLVSAHSTEVDLYLFQPNSGIAQGYTGKSYGTAWLAYRHKPREEDR